jgi:SecD/SecF fusion protein
MSEVLTRSIATTSCTLLPIIALLLFGGSTLKDFAFALLIGVASGAYSSIFIASPVLTHWKERESQYRHRRARIESEFGYVPAYASVGGDVEPTTRRSRRAGRLTTPDADSVSAAEFEQMKRDIAEAEQEASRTSTLTKRLARSRSADAPAPRTQKPRPKGTPARGAEPGPAAAPQPRDGSDGAGNGAPPSDGEAGRPDEVRPAPDVPENEGVALNPKRPSKPRARNRRHGRRR